MLNTSQDVFSPNVLFRCLRVFSLKASLKTKWKWSCYDMIMVSLLVSESVLLHSSSPSILIYFSLNILNAEGAFVHVLVLSQHVTLI